MIQTPSDPILHWIKCFDHVLRCFEDIFNYLYNLVQKLKKMCVCNTQNDCLINYNKSVWLSPLYKVMQQMLALSKWVDKQRGGMQIAKSQVH